MIYLIFFCREALGIVFASAGFMKLVDRPRFAAAVRGYRLVPDRVTAPLSWLPPVTELLTGIGLIAAFPPRWSPVAAAALSLLFGLAVVINLARGNRNIACGCFGSSEDHQIGWGIVGRNIGFALAATTLVLQDTGYVGDAGGIAAISERLVVFCMAAATVGLWSLSAITSKYV